jgi:hypothetical protein
MRTFILAILGLTLSTHLLRDAAIRPTQAADPQPTVASQWAAQPKKVKPPLLTWQEKQWLLPLEKRLLTPFNNKANPGDRDTYFVLMFRDVAGVQTHSRTRSSSSITESLATEVAKWDGAIIIHGRKEAALTVARFLTKDNAAARSLEVPGQHAEQKSQLASNKVWDYRAFATEELAQLYLISSCPPVRRRPRATSDLQLLVAQYTMADEFKGRPAKGTHRRLAAWATPHDYGRVTVTVLLPFSLPVEVLT